MSYQVLAIKWRPKLFKEVIGQEHVTRSLVNSIRTKNIAHAYLLAGTRGVGKTTLSRIYAKALNCKNLSSDYEPCLKCSSCESIENSTSLNYQEIDGASNNGVEHIRAMIESCQYLPTEGEYKIYVIDEVHMLSNNAFNALLKTLEEPPKHVIFIFATTNPEKLLETVVSRCLRLDLRSVSQGSLVEIVKNISKDENITFENDEVINTIAKSGNGSIRDTLTLLEQLKSFSNGSVITEESLFYSMGLANKTQVESIVNCLISGDERKLTNLYKNILSENIDLKSFCLQILEVIYEKIQKGMEDNKASKKLISIYKDLSKNFSWMIDSIAPDEIILIKMQSIALGDNLAEEVVLEKNSLDKSKDTNKPIKVESKILASVEKSEVIQKEVQKQEIKPEKKKEEAPKKKGSFSYRNFITFLKTKRPASAANLEFGNVFSLKKTEENNLELVIGFKEDSIAIYEYFQEEDVRKSLEIEFQNFIDRSDLVAKIKTKLLNDDEIAEKKFVAIVEIDEGRQEKTDNEKISEFKSNSVILEAEKLFNQKIEDYKIKR